MPGQIRKHRFVRIRGNGRADRRLRRLNHGRISAASIHQQPRRKRRTARKVSPLKNTFTNGDGIARLDAKTSAATLVEFLGINLKDLVPVRTLPSHCYSFRRSDTRISAGQRDRFQQIDTAWTGLGHFIAAGPTDLSQDREPPLGVTQEHDVDFWVYQIIAAVQLSKL